MAKRDKPVDARDVVGETFGSPNRDAAVDPRPGDYLPPTNAGKADPHGPLVVAPGIHAVGPSPLRPGEVHVDDAAQQEKEETALAKAVLVDGDLATSVAEDFDGTPKKGNMGPLGLSDPGSADMGEPSTPKNTKRKAAPKGTKK